jgi:hypothetical protein
LSQFGLAEPAKVDREADTELEASLYRHDALLQRSWESYEMMNIDQRSIYDRIFNSKQYSTVPRQSPIHTTPAAASPRCFGWKLGRRGDTSNGVELAIAAKLAEQFVYFHGCPSSHHKRSGDGHRATTFQHISFKDDFVPIQQLTDTLYSHTQVCCLAQHSIHLFQAYSCSHIPETHQIRTRLQSLRPCLQPCLETSYTHRQTILVSLSALLHYAVDDIAKVIVEALFHADGELVLSFALGAGFTKYVSHEDFELTERAGRLGTVFRGGV